MLCSSVSQILNSMTEIIIKQSIITDVELSNSNSNGVDYIKLVQDGATIFLEKSKAVELQKAINQLK